MDDEIIRALEAIIIVADSPVPPRLLAQLVERPLAEVEQCCKELGASYEVDGRGFILANVAGGYRIQSHPDLAPYVERYVLEGQSGRLSAAALETLAIVAYKQPISRAQVSSIRGVNVEAVMRTLEARGYIAEIGRDPGPGLPALFGTTTQFLEKLGLDSLADLPALSDFVPGTDVLEALEAGLRPDGEDLAREPDIDGVPDRPLVVAPSDAAEPVGPGAADDEVPLAIAGHESEQTDLSGDTREDATARLDDATARLDALVDRVRSKIEATEQAIADADAVEDSGEPGGDAHGSRADPTAPDRDDEGARTAGDATSVVASPVDLARRAATEGQAADADEAATVGTDATGASGPPSWA